MPRKAARKAAQPEGAATPQSTPAEDPRNRKVTVVFRSVEQGDLRIEVLERLLGRLAIAWTYIVRQRRRWYESASALSELERRATQELSLLGCNANELRSRVSTHGLIEVSTPFQDESIGWSARIMPWEFFLRAALRRPNLVVIRHLDLGASDKRIAKPGRMVFVQSAPAPLDVYAFELERRLVEGSIQASEFVYLENPTVEDTLTRVSTAFASRTASAGVVHISGIDLHQGEAVLAAAGVTASSRSTDPESEDGLYFFLPESPGYRAVSALEFSTLLKNARLTPDFIVFNAYYSASRIAPLAVAGGAQGALGIQDRINDNLAERFYASFYQRWKSSGSLLTAYIEAWRWVARDDPWSSGIVLWTRQSLIKEKRAAGKPEKTAPLPLQLTDTEIRPLACDVQPNPTVNYSLLHNDEGLFQKFSIYKFTPNYAYGIHVEVTLNLDTDSFSYSTTIDMKADDVVADLSRRITLPLTSRFSRSIRESVFSSLRIRVSYGGLDLYCDTHRVQLLAVNEWRYDRHESTRWLASFVLPGDPAVAGIVDTAQKYLMALRDDSGAGFDGYQSTGETAEEPHEGVDLQVRALWSALSFEIAPSYINPPPVFQDASQRLRTPSDTIGGRRGTCIDLALLMAACLEYVEIYPVIFLLSDHAFPGYWRSDAAYQNYISMRRASAPETELAGEDGDGALVPGAASPDPVTQSRLEFEEVRQLLRDGQVVPIETVWLTRRMSFAEAIEAGIENLTSSSNYEGMLDIRRARELGVTPLPIAGGQS